MRTRKRTLIEALIGPDDGRLLRLWHTNAEFHYAIAQLSELLPAMVDGLATAAEAQEKKLAQMRRVAMQETAPQGGVADLPVTTYDEATAEWVRLINKDNDW
jgi:hypothetical protein